MVTLRPLEDHVLVEIFEAEKTTASGIVLPDNNTEKPNKWKVVAVGEGKILDDGKRAPMDVKVGDIVYFTKYSPDEIEVNGKPMLIIRHGSVLAEEK